MPAPRNYINMYFERFFPFPLRKMSVAAVAINELAGKHSERLFFPFLLK